MATSEQHPSTTDYRSYHFLLLDQLVLTMMVDGGGDIIDTAISVVPELDDETATEINLRIIAEAGVEIADQARVHAVARDLREILEEVVSSLLARYAASSILAAASAEVLQ